MRHFDTRDEAQDGLYTDVILADVEHLQVALRVLLQRCTQLLEALALDQVQCQVQLLQGGVLPKRIRDELTA